MVLKKRIGICATTGTAASLLPGGLTMHRLFKIPLKVNTN